MTKRTRFSNERLNKAVRWTVPYSLAGVAAPFLFKYVNTPKQAGAVAGFLFVSAALWALVASRLHKHELWAQAFFLVTLVLNSTFWSWRLANSDLPLRESYLLGLSGADWHGLLTALYLTGMILLLIQEYRTTR
jgi:hypothetical protein